MIHSLGIDLVPVDKKSDPCRKDPRYWRHVIIPRTAQAFVSPFSTRLFSWP